MFARLSNFLLGAVVLAALAVSPVMAKADEVLVFAAASLKTALDQVADDWRLRTGKSVTISYAGSSQLARQIEQGAPADIFISASVQWMDYLDQAKLIDPKSRTDLLGNTLVLIAHGSAAAAMKLDTDLDLAGLLGDEKLAMALVDSVPAGVYGKAVLTSLGLWDAVAPKVAQTDNVRAALALVASGEAPYGIVYATDAVAEDDVSVVGTFAEETHDPIIYPAAMLSASDADTQAFFDELMTPHSAEVFKAQGFKPLFRQGDG